MQEKRFQKNDKGFICAVCGAEVSPLGYTSRDHCPKCLCSLHVDVMPGDRANECQGILRPQQTEPSAKRGFIITYKCDKCSKTVRNKWAEDDDMSLIIKLTTPKQW